MKKIKIELSKEASKSLRDPQLKKKFEKQKKLFLENPNHPSLNFKKVKPKELNIWQFKVDKKNRTRMTKKGNEYFVTGIGNFHG